MNEIHVADRGCRHLAVLTGDERELDQLLEGEFRLASALPPPAGIEDADELAVIAFHLVFGELSEARRISDEIAEPWPFPSDAPDSSEVRKYLRLHPELNRAAQQVLSTLQRTGHVSARAWKRDNWGHSQDLRGVEVTRPQEDVAVLRFEEPVNRLAALLNLALRKPGLQVAALVQDEPQLAQFWFDSGQLVDGAIKLHEQRFDNDLDLLQNSWFEHLPERFPRF